jgi:predicted O-linked N-acetylglucosamine transferase (SPINDLY family)
MAGSSKRKGHGHASPDQQVESLFKTAYAHHIKNETLKAESLYRKILQMAPGHSNALNLLGTIALERGDCDTALGLFQRAVRSYPQGAIFHNNLGTACRKAGRPEEAERAYREALRVDPDYVEARNNLGTMLQDKGDMEGAIECFEAACRKNPGFSPAHYNLGRVFCEQGRIETSLWSYRQALKINPGFVEAGSNLLYTLHFSDTVSPERIFEEHRGWAESFARPFYPENPRFERDTDPYRPLRIGYVSPDFCTHSVAFFLEDVLAAHDRNLYTVYCYSNTPNHDAFTERFKELADVWRDIRSLSDDETADMIRRDEIDILVDLCGHTRNNRILVFARKPAPVQVTWLGYPDTTGLDTMDYRLTDDVADPVGESEKLHSEKLYRLPDGFLCYRPSGEASPVSPPPCLKTEGITFGSFNNNSKISETTVALWAKILKRVPGSRLKLKARSFDDFGTRKYLLERFDDHGIPADRIWFEGYAVGLREHFLLYGSVDIALDTFPYNGTTTTCEALWMGVPVVALRGDSHVSRVGADILSRLGLDEWVTSSHDRYVDIAVGLAGDTERLQRLRVDLRQRMSASHLMNPKNYTAELEKAFRTMWRSWTGNDSRTAEKEIRERTMDIHPNNIKALRNNHPELLNATGPRCPFGLEVVSGNDGRPNLRMTDSDGVRLLYPADHPTLDISGLLGSLNGIRGKVICIMGGGLFLHAQPVMDAVGDVNHLVFFEAFPEMFEQALRTVDLSRILSHPNCSLAVGDLADPYRVLDTISDKVFLNQGGIFFSNGNLTGLNPAWYRDKQKTFEQYLNRRSVSRKVAVHGGRRFLENGLQNLTEMIEARPLDALEGRFKGLPAILVASGPSLSGNIDRIKLYGDKAVIIAADSAVAALVKHGVTPHVVVSLDFNDFTFEKLAPFHRNLASSVLVFLSSVTPKIVRYIRFRETYLSYADKGSKDLFEQILGKGNKGFEEAQSVIHLALNAAQIAGCDPIVFTGIDFSYSERNDHVEGTILHWGNNHAGYEGQPVVAGSMGGMLKTSREFLSMLEIFEQTMAHCPDRRYVDATEGGARKKGADIMPLVAAGDLYFQSDISIPEPSPVEPLKDRRAEALLRMKDLRTTVERCLGSIEDYERNKETVDGYFESQSSAGQIVRQLPKSVLKPLRRMDSINIALEKETVFHFLNGMMAEFLDEYLAYEIKIKQVKDHHDPIGKLRLTLEQQGFIQGVRKVVLVRFLQSLNIQITFLTEMKCMGSGDGGAMEQARFLYLNDRLADASTLLQTLPAEPERDFMIAAIDLRRGEVLDGKQIIDVIVSVEPDFKQRADSLYRQMLDQWMADSHLQSYRKICIDRALILCPDDTEVLKLRYTWLKNRTLDLFGSGDRMQILVELQDEDKRKPIFDAGLCMFMALLHFINNDMAEGTVFIERALNDESASQGRTDVLQRFRGISEGAGLFDPVGRWVTLWIEKAHTDSLYIQLLHEIINVVIEPMEQKVFFHELPNDEILRIEKKIDIWSCLQDVCPEWWLKKALCALGMDRFEEAMIALRKADYLCQGLKLKIGEKRRYEYLFCIFNLYADLVNEALLARSRMLFDEKDPFIWDMMWVFLLIRNGSIDLAEDIFKRAVLKEIHTVVGKGFVNAYESGSLIPDIQSMDGIHGFSAWFLLMANYMISTGNSDGGRLYLRASVNVDSRAVEIMEARSLTSYANDLWIEDSKNLCNRLDQGDTESAERILWPWSNARSILTDYCILMSRIIAAKTGQEDSLSYLMDSLEADPENSELLVYCVRSMISGGEFERARSMIESGMAFDRGYAPLWEELGDAYYGKNDYAAALTVYEKCFEFLPDRVDVLQKIGDLYFISGNRESARVAYETILMYSPNNNIVRERLQTLQNSKDR